MNILLFLIMFPFVVAFVLLGLPTRQYAIRKFIIIGSAIVLSGVSIYLASQYFSGGPRYFSFDSTGVDMAILFAEMVFAGIIAGLSVKHKQYFTALLMLTGAGLMLGYEIGLGGTVHAEEILIVDNLSLIMALIIGVIGCLIALFSMNYMKTYHERHPEVKDRTGFFFFIIFAFLGAMYGVVFANSLVWLFGFWEITTLCSFLLIGYSQQDEANRNAFRALKMNLLGGIGFATAIILLAYNDQVTQLNQLSGLSTLLPIALLAFAGLTKSAQMPFSSWLLGAMVAPTPVSALLHSSAMVKAGVYLIIRLSPIFAFDTGAAAVGIMVALVGAVTFVITSFLAISQTDAKRVLAYSTIANLGLIVVCAGVGSYQLFWAAIMLVIFHAVAKSLLFLSVGSVEHNLGQRSIEHMDGLISYMPKVAVGMVIGILGMFLAPFGMLISKWAALEGLVNSNVALTIFVAFGGAATLFFWSKWLGKIIMVKSVPADFKAHISRSEGFSLGSLAVLTVLVCLSFPLISRYFLEPLIETIYNQTYLLGAGNTAILLLMMGLMLVLPLTLLRSGKRSYRDQYLAGANTGSEQFHGSLGTNHSLTMRSFYLKNVFGEDKLFNLSVVICIILILIMIGVGL